MDRYMTEAEALDLFDDDEDYDEYDDEYDDWEDDYSDALESAEEADDLSGDGMFEVFADYEPDMFDDAAALAEALREVLNEDYQDATPEEMQDILFNILDTMTPAAEFSVTSALRKISQAGKKVLRDPTVSQIAQTALPLTGSALGTIYAGPVGTDVGGKLGQAAGQAFTGGRKRWAMPAPAKKAAGNAMRGVTSVSHASSQSGSAAAAKLLGLTQNPDMLKSLLALALGSQGRESIQVGQDGPPVQLDGFMNLLSQLVSEAVADADELLRESEEMSAYLRDSEDDFLADADSAVSEDYAQILYETMSDAENQQLATEAALYSAYLELADELDEEDDMAFEDMPY